MPRSPHSKLTGKSTDIAALRRASVNPLAKMVAPSIALSLLGPKKQKSGASRQEPIVITLGSPKGGTGKSTTAVLLTVALLKLGYRIGCMDLDGQQATMSRYLANRSAYIGGVSEPLEMPQHCQIQSSLRTNREIGEQEEKRKFCEALSCMADCNYVVIDTPGNNCHLSSLGCKQADVVLTPLNDSLLDIDVLARIEPRKRLVLAPSEYSRMIWRENDRRVALGHRPIDWVVIRNRLGYTEAKNTETVSALLVQLSKRLGFRLAHGLSERVVFRELFLHGLTLLDLPSDKFGNRNSRGHAKAHREVGGLLGILGVVTQNVEGHSNLHLGGQ